MFEHIAKAISQATGQSFHHLKTVPIGGGCINSAYKLEGQNHRFFVKLNQAKYLTMFEAEASGLQEIAESQTVNAPNPICHGIAENQAYLVLEYLNLRPAHHASQIKLGQQLAAMHQIRKPYYGWHRDNTIGSTPQINSPGDDWPSFWAKQRLGFQLALAAKHDRLLQSKGEKLLENLPCFFQNHHPMPSLLHGDLWSGNFSSDDSGRAVIYDPACYYGDREADIAMTELFGGFGKDFYAAYADSLPLDPGYRVRKNLYNLYHILNHLNLFGRSYLSQATNMIDALLAESR